MASGRGRLLVVSHPAVLTANQGVYALLGELGWEVHLLAPARWPHDYGAGGVHAQALPELASRFRAWPVLMAGRPQRHVYLRPPGRLLAAVKPDVAFLEEEPFALAAAQWVGPLSRRGVPFGVQQDENLERRLPRVAEWVNRRTLPRAAFVAARSPRAAELVRRHRDVPAPVIPHTVLQWEPRPPRSLGPGEPLVVGYAGRLVPEKGLHDLLAAIRRMREPVRLRCFGAGPLQAELEAASTAEHPVEVVTGIRHEQMGEAYASVDVLALPSRTTPTWSEQFGRVLVEAMSCGRPVVASDSGEIPWVVGEGGGGLLFPEGDVEALAARLDELAANEALRFDLGRRGIEGAARAFSPEAVAAKLDEALASAR